MEQCRICGTREGKKIAEVNYWDLRESNLIKCDTCGMMQLDPMLTSKDIELGCTAYSYFSDPPEKEERNSLRCYRRGIAFASRLKQQRFCPQRILEIGPGNGYFSRGVKFVFPEARITVLDIVDSLLEYNQKVHGFTTLKGTPENLNPEIQADKFNLIIARDVLEHVSDIGKVITNIYGLLENGGLFNFVTPNGLEDAWQYYLCWKLNGKPAQALLNHVNFFDPMTLKGYIKETGFEIQSYYIYTLKNFFRGKGWWVRAKHIAEISTKKSAKESIKIKCDSHETGFQQYDFIKSPLMSLGWLTQLYCRYKHPIGIKVPSGLKIGHEIFCIAQKI
jgi:Methylase involved in ubiquinone/menaquinone biosynthesis